MADPIHLHPAMRRILLELRVRTEGMRALGYWAAHWLDIAAEAADPALRCKAETLAALLTPIVKASFTSQGFELASKALQVFGGYGYTAEFPIEQTLRDSRIAMIYEGSNEIQANDLLLRKVLGDGGEGFGLLLGELRSEADAVVSVFAEALGEVCDGLEGLLPELRAFSAEEGEYPYRAAGDFLQLCSISLLAFAWARSARCVEGLAEPLRREKLESAGFCFDYLLPEFDRQMAAVRAARAPLAFIG